MNTIVTKVKSTAAFQPAASKARGNIFRTGRAGLMLGTLVAGLSGCNQFMQQPHCPTLEACGGDIPYGEWVLGEGHMACIEDLYLPATDTRLVAADQPPARVPLPEPALFDWCTLLVANGGKSIQAAAPRFYYESGQIGDATVRFEQDGRYTAGIARVGTFALDFPAYCMRAFGAMDDRPLDPENDPDGERGNVCKQLQVPLRKAGTGEGAYPNTTCEPNPADPNGCLCRFDVQEVGGSAGPFSRLNNNTLLHIPITTFPQKVNYCFQGDRLQLTGADGQYLFDQRGLRTLDLVRKKQE